MFLVGEVIITSVWEKEYDGRKYYKAQAIAKDKCVYSLSLPYEDRPQVDDVYQMIIEPSSKDFKATARYQRAK